MDYGLVVLVRDGIGAAFLRTFAAAAAELFIDYALARRMLLHLAGTAAAAHADVLDGAAKARGLVSLEMCKADEDVGIHDGTANLGILDVFAILHWDFHVIRTAQAVADDDLAARRRRVETVEIRAVHMLQGMLAAARIKRVAVRQKRHAALLLDEVCHDFRILRTQICHVAELTEMHLDGHELAIHIDVLDTRCNAERLELLHDIAANRHTKIRKINFRLFHDNPPKI